MNNRIAVLAVFASCLFLASSMARSLTIPAEGKYLPALGYDSVMREPRDMCLENIPTDYASVWPPADTNSATSDYLKDYKESSEKLAEYLNISLSVQANWSAGNASAALDVVNSFQSASFNSWATIGVVVKFNQQAIPLTNVRFREPAVAAANDMQTFVDMCGDSFMWATTQGLKAQLVHTFSSLDSLEFKSVSASMKGAAAGYSGSASYDQTFNKELSDKKIYSKVVYSGGPTTIPSDPAGFDKFARDLYQSKKVSPYPIEYQLASYRSVPGFGDLPFVRRAAALDRAGDIYATKYLLSLQRRLRDLQAVRDNSSRNVTYGKVSVTSLDREIMELGDAIPRVSAGVRACLRAGGADCEQFLKSEVDEKRFIKVPATPIVPVDQVRVDVKSGIAKLVAEVAVNDRLAVQMRGKWFHNNHGSEGKVCNADDAPPCDGNQFIVRSDKSYDAQAISVFPANNSCWVSPGTTLAYKASERFGNLDDNIALYADDLPRVAVFRPIYDEDIRCYWPSPDRPPPATP